MPASQSTAALYVTGGDSGDRECREAAPPILTRLATNKDIIEYYGERQRSTIRAIVAEMNGRVVGIIGIVREQGYGKMFVDVDPELQPPLRSITIMRAVKQAMRFADDYRGPIVAVAEDAESCRIMNRLGWTHLQGALYGWLK